MEIFGVESLVLYPAQISIICSEEDKILISCFPGPLARDIQEMDEVMPPLSREPVLSSREQSKDSTSTNYWLEVKEFSIETKTSLHDPLWSLAAAIKQEFEFLIKARLNSVGAALGGCYKPRVFVCRSVKFIFYFQ